MMTLYPTRKAGTEPIPLSLPATPADIGNAFAELDAICPDPSATEIYKVDSEVRNLSRYICIWWRYQGWRSILNTAPGSIRCT